MTSVTEHGDQSGHGALDDRGHGSLCDERGHGSLPLQGLRSIVMRVVMEDRNESGHEAL